MLKSTFKVNNNLIKIIHLIDFKIDNRPNLIKINIRENRRDNHEWITQRNWQHKTRYKTQDADKQNKQKTQYRKLKEATRTPNKSGVNPNAREW